MTATGKTKPIEDLIWYYRESDHDLGHRAAPLEPSGGGNGFTTDALALEVEPGWMSPAPPNKRKLRAAARARRMRWILGLLTMAHRGSLETAYQMRNFASMPGGPELESRYGLAAGIILHDLGQVRLDPAKLSQAWVVAAQHGQKKLSYSHKRAISIASGSCARLAEAHAAFLAAKDWRRGLERSERERVRELRVAVVQEQRAAVRRVKRERDPRLVEIVDLLASVIA